MSKQDYSFKQSKFASHANPKENLIEVNKEEGKTQKNWAIKFVQSKTWTDQLSVPVGYFCKCKASAYSMLGWIPSFMSLSCTDPT